MVAAWCLAAMVGAQAAAKVDFVHDIRPILSDHCFSCHGQDDQARKGQLRLDRKEEAFKAGKSGKIAIMPGKPDESELIRRVRGADPDDLMPPAKTKKPLSSAQIDILRRWVAEGAEYTAHWAFEAPKRPVVPSDDGSSFVRNPIDAFVLARLKKEGLSPSPEADRTTLIRRVTLDLTGLPPALEEIDAFLKDRDPKAYEKVVDRLLKSPRYGEHMVRYWLDAARYADSHGFHIDSQRDIWPYRDWVIRSFNQNMPFDQFTIEQLAGDLLPGSTADQKVATGYIRCNMSTGEGGAIEAEYQAKYAFDRVETTGAVWLGLTLTCARCHTHKYDPISHKEYYGLFSFFNSLDEPVMDDNRPDPNPVLRLPSLLQAQRQGVLKGQIAEMEKQIAEPISRLDRDQAAWQRQWHRQLSEEWRPLEIVSAVSRPKATNCEPAVLVTQGDGSILARGENPGQDVHEIRLRSIGGMLSAVRLEALPHASLPHSGSGRSETGDFLLSEIEAEWSTRDVKEEAGKPRPIKFGRALATSEAKSFEAGKSIDGKPETGWSGDATRVGAAMFVLAEPVEIPAGAELSVRLRFEASTNHQALGSYRLSAVLSKSMAERLIPRFFDPWQQIGPFPHASLNQGFTNVYPPEKGIDLKAAYKGKRGEIRWGKRDYADGVYHELVHEIHGVHGVYYLDRTVRREEETGAELVFNARESYKVWLNGELVAWSTNRQSQVAQRVPVRLPKGDNRMLCKVVSEAASSGFLFRLDVHDPSRIPPEMAAALALSDTPPPTMASSLRDHFRKQSSAGMRRRVRELELLKEEQRSLEQSIASTLIAKELAKPRETTILLRGEYDKKGDKVEPHLPAVLPPMPEGAPANRLGLAKWLVDPAHPLTARVTINRFWQQYFGVGLVKTSEDFGVQSERPSHPELLDWLATEFVAQRWNIKHMVREIVSSSTYRQSSKASASLRALDPENRLLARGPRFRMDGEMLRDMALSVGGLLEERLGGRSAKPYEPGGLWEAVSFNNVQRYVVDVDENQYRRSVYTHWKRQSPPPGMLVFDAPTREYCVTRRPRTNTPLQALGMLNDPQFVEAANAFGERILEHGGRSLESRIQYGFRVVTGRRPDPSEVETIRAVFKDQQQEFRRNPSSVDPLLSVRSFRPSRSWDRAELAAWSSVASMLMNLDETVTKQ